MLQASISKAVVVYGEWIFLKDNGKVRGDLG